MPAPPVGTFQPLRCHALRLTREHKPDPPYTHWATVATNSQDVVDAAATAEVVMVTNGLYAFGGTETFDTNGASLGFSCVAVTNAISLQSANGPPFTVIDGGRWEGERRPGHSTG